MRYLGNKARLIDPIVEAARRTGFTRGTVCDLFAGTAVVGRAFRERGCRVLSNDVMAASFVQQRVALELAGPPTFEGLCAALDLPPAHEAVARLPRGAVPSPPWEPSLRVAAHLEALRPAETGFIARQYAPQLRDAESPAVESPDAECPAAESPAAESPAAESPAARVGERRYFTPENARRLDAWIQELQRWQRAGWLAPGELAFLTAAVVDAADRVANISGTYGAYLKRWQRNALTPVELVLPAPGAGPPGQAHQGDAFEWLPGVEADLLYLDPPYNGRQYGSNYHVLEVLARLPTEGEPAALEASLYGKTGLLPLPRSILCSRSGTRCRDAFRDLLASTRIPRVVISYSEEGIVSRAEFEDLLAEYAGVARARLGKVLTVQPYRRFRSDRDGRVLGPGSSRAYRELPGRQPGEVHEWLFHVARKRRRA